MLRYAFLRFYTIYLISPLDTLLSLQHTFSQHPIFGIAIGEMPSKYSVAQKICKYRTATLTYRLVDVVGHFICIRIATLRILLLVCRVSERDWSCSRHSCFDRYCRMQRLWLRRLRQYRELEWTTKNKQSVRLPKQLKRLHFFLLTWQRGAILRLILIYRRHLRSSEFLFSVI